MAELPAPLCAWRRVAAPAALGSECSFAEVARQMTLVHNAKGPLQVLPLRPHLKSVRKRPICRNRATQVVKAQVQNLKGENEMRCISFSQPQSLVPGGSAGYAME